MLNDLGEYGSRNRCQYEAPDAVSPDEGIGLYFDRNRLLETGMSQRGTHRYRLESLLALRASTMCSPPYGIPCIVRIALLFIFITDQEPLVCACDLVILDMFNTTLISEYSLNVGPKGELRTAATVEFQDVILALATYPPRWIEVKYTGAGG